MAAPPYVWRNSLLYSKIPELEQIDLDIGSMYSIQVDDTTSNEYTQTLSNCGSFSNLFTQNKFIVSRYILFLESSIMSSKSKPDVINLIEQKVRLLESAYSNLNQVSTQSV